MGGQMADRMARLRPPDLADLCSARRWHRNTNRGLRESESGDLPGPGATTASLCRI
jgi:hypothetical protein